MREKLVIFGKYFLTIINIIAAAASIIGLIYTLKVSISLWTIVFICSALICLISIVSLIGVNLSVKNDRVALGKIYSQCFHELLHKIRYALEEDDEIQDTHSLTNSFEYRKKITEKSIDLMNKISTKLTEAFGIEIRACIKLFNFIDINSQQESQIITFARSGAETHNMIDEQFRKIKLSENTDFEYLFNHHMEGSEDNPAFFFQKDLIKYARESKYKNSTKNWRKQYKTTIVMPIRCLKVSPDSPPYYDLLGYLCVDSKNRKAFSSGYTTFILELLKGTADILYHYYDGCTGYYKELKCQEMKASTMKGGS